ncbi:hypothetical protein PSEUDO8AS_40578 [Pseudomonas sp. 8AS]|nr:hypothetical protein PSEUDO8AS_40578 [Pseudomonas sp. 8AS]
MLALIMQCYNRDRKIEQKLLLVEACPPIDSVSSGRALSRPNRVHTPTALQLSKGQHYGYEPSTWMIVSCSH